jgi:hypothetical protein
MLRTRRDARTDRLVAACAHRGVSLALAAAIAVTDHVAHQQQLPFLWRGLMDEPRHLATAMIVLGTLARWRGHPPSSGFVWAMLSASVLIDLDHLPLELGSGVLTAGAPRPYTHALWVLVLLVVAAAATRWRDQVSGSARAGSAAVIAAGAAWGVAAHFLRDVATAPIALWWPVSSAGVQVPGYWYLPALLVLATLPPPRKRP